MKKAASNNQAQYPESASAVVKKFYLDDYLDYFQNRDDALEICRDLVSLLKLGGFHLTKNISNVPDVTTALEPDKYESSVEDIFTSSDESSNDLGLK